MCARLTSMWRSEDKFQESAFSSHHMGFETSTQALRLVASAFAGKPHLILPAQVLFYSWISSRVLTSTPASASRVLQIKVYALFLIFKFFFFKHSEQRLRKNRTPKSWGGRWREPLFLLTQTFDSRLESNPDSTFCFLGDLRKSQLKAMEASLARDK